MPGLADAEMNRAEKIRRQAPGLAEGDVSALASLGTAEVDIITRALRQARRDALAEAAERKRQRKADDRAHSNYDESDFSRRNLAVVASQGKRAGRGSLDALAALGQLQRHARTWISWGVEGCRAQGLSDAEIGAALGVTKQAVQARYSRQGILSRDDAV